MGECPHCFLDEDLLTQLSSPRAWSVRGEALRVSQSFRVVAPSFEYLFYRFFFELVTKKDSVCVVDVNLLSLKIVRGFRGGLIVPSVSPFEILNVFV